MSNQVTHTPHPPMGSSAPSTPRTAYLEEKNYFPPEEKNKCYLVTCYPLVFSILHFHFNQSPSRQSGSDLLRSAHPLEAFREGANRDGPLHSSFSSFSLFFSIYSLGRIYTYIYRAHDMLISMVTVTRQHFRSTAFRDKCKIKADNR